MNNILKRLISILIISVIFSIEIKANNTDVEIDSGESVILKKVRIESALIDNILKEYVMPDAKRWGRTPKDFDFYISIYNLDDGTSNLSISLEKTQHVPFDLFDKYVAYTERDNYIMFLNEEFVALYTVSTGNEESFSFCSGNERGDPESSRWSFEIIGDPSNSPFIRKKLIAEYIESITAKEMRAKRLSNKFLKNILRSN